MFTNYLLDILRRNAVKFQTDIMYLHSIFLFRLKCNYECLLITSVETGAHSSCVMCRALRTVHERIISSNKLMTLA